MHQELGSVQGEYIVRWDGVLIFPENDIVEHGSKSSGELVAAALSTAGIMYCPEISDEVVEVTYRRFSGMQYSGLELIRLFIQYKADGLLVS